MAPHPLERLRQLTLGLNIEGSKRSFGRKLRKLALSVIAGGRHGGAGLAEGIEGLVDAALRHQEECASWVSPDAMLAGGGRFDACDLRHWLALADAAGVASVPARVVCALSEDEMAVMSGKVALPNAVSARIGTAMTRAADRLAEERNRDQSSGAAPEDLSEAETATLMSLLGSPGEDMAGQTLEDIREKLMAAMDDLPEGWMIRHVRCGASTIKAMAGCGASGPQVPEVRFGSDLEIGPGWVRLGNRRMIDAADPRFVEQGCAHGPGGDQVFVARPWVAASRWMMGEDPHRHGTPFAGKGCWPAEWRVLVEQGRVVGVTSYYAWADRPSPEAALAALQVRDLAQRIVDKAVALGAVPRFAPTEMLRADLARGRVAPQVAQDQALRACLERFAEGGVDCTLDFIETAEGPLFLEGGPPYIPHPALGGGHPCGFAGVVHPDGVAFTVLPGVCLGDSRTWRVEAMLGRPGSTPWSEEDRRGHHLDWSAVERLTQLEPDSDIDTPMP